MNINDLLPEAIIGFHDQTMIEFVYGKHVIDDITPFSKNTFCMYGDWLVEVEINTKLCLIGEELTAVGFMKFLSIPDGLIMMCHA
jgi:hypothetical protein